MMASDWMHAWVCRDIMLSRCVGVCMTCTVYTFHETAIPASTLQECREVCIMLFITPIPFPPYWLSLGYFFSKTNLVILVWFWIVYAYTYSYIHACDQNSTKPLFEPTHRTTLSVHFGVAVRLEVIGQPCLYPGYVCMCVYIMYNVHSSVYCG